MDRPKRQTATATPAKPGGLPLTLDLESAWKTGGAAASPLLVALPERLRPAGFRLLAAARHRKRVGLDRLGDDRARADIGAVADRDRRDEGRVRADEGAGADVGLVLGEAVVIAGDSSRADVGVRPDSSVADIGQMIDLGAFLDLGLLDLDEVADSRVGGDVRPRPQPRIRPDRRAPRHPRALEMRERADGRAILD